MMIGFIATIVVAILAGISTLIIGLAVICKAFDFVMGE